MEAVKYSKGRKYGLFQTEYDIVKYRCILYMLFRYETSKCKNDEYNQSYSSPTKGMPKKVNDAIHSRKHCNHDTIEIAYVHVPLTEMR